MLLFDHPRLALSIVECYFKSLAPLSTNVSLTLTPRQENLLRYIVRDFVEIGRPVGSGALVERHHLAMSPATVRNEMAHLNELGLIAQMHTSGGRLPTESGYRYFVEKLIQTPVIADVDREAIEDRFSTARLDLNQWMRLAAAALAQTSGDASFITAPRFLKSRYKLTQLISTEGRLVLMVLVLGGGVVEQQMLTLAEPLSQEFLTAAAESLNQRFVGMTAGQLDQILERSSEFDREILGLAVDSMKRIDARAVRQIYYDGLANIVDDKSARSAVEVLEERSLLDSLITDAESAPTVGGVQVIIGGEGRWESLLGCTIILSRYGIASDLVGDVAVVGPTRMAYGRNISAVRYVASLMSNFVREFYLGDVTQPSN